MNIVLMLLSIYGLAFLIKDSDGPWGMMNWLRRVLVNNRYVGAFFYKLLDCYFCVGWWAGLAIYFLSQESYKLNWAILWGLSGAAVSLILDGLVSRLHRE